MNPESRTPQSVAVIIATLRRPTYVRNCLAHISTQTLSPNEVVVVDASPDEETYRIVSDEFPDVRYLRNPFGAGTTATSRDIGFRSVSSDVIVFLDDDAYAHPECLEQLLEEYADPTVGGAGGRALNGRPGEEVQGSEGIGMLLPDGTLTGNFAADPGRTIEVDHLLGANMSFRRVAIESVGGIHDGYPGTCLREETDLAFRVSGAGWRLVYTPRAVVDHVAGPYAKGKRFDLRYAYYAQRNHVVLLVRTLGRSSPQLRRYLQVGGITVLSELARSARGAAQLRHRGIARTARTVVGGVSRAAVTAAGLVVGLCVGWTYARRERGDRHR